MNYQCIESFITKEGIHVLKLHVFYKYNKYFLLSENGTSILIDEQLYQSIVNNNMCEDLQVKLIQRQMAYIDKPPIQTEDKVTYFILDITKKCNFHCIYCMRSLTENKTITYQTLVDVLKYIEAYCKRNKVKNITIQAWGGEPILDFDDIFFINDYFSDTNIHCNSDVETNASLVNDDIAKKLYKNNIRIGVSIDGYDVLHNQQRKYPNGKDTFSDVLKGIRALQKYYGNNIGIICIITKYNIDKVKEMVKYFYFDLNIHSVKFNIVRDNPNALASSLQPSFAQIETFVDALFNELLAYNMLNIAFSEGNIQTRLDNLINAKQANICESRGCKGGRRMLAFDYKGDIYPCEVIDFPELKIGSVYDKELLEIQLQKAYQNNVYFDKHTEQKCQKCPWLIFCQGGCTSRQFYCQQKSCDEVTCLINRKIYPAIIENILADIL
ncbi:MAG: radical SAM protein [Erysipelotrichaceae bacterium]|nr:radical SAM protein [Erysipelotrichaceae bacterium]